MRAKAILVYLSLLPFAFTAFATAWLFVAPTCLYYCWDDAWPFAISWSPPFIHTWANSTDGTLRDYYRAPEWVVYSVWLALVAGALLVPIYGVRSFFRLRHNNEPA